MLLLTLTTILPSASAIFPIANHLATIFKQKIHKLPYYWFWRIFFLSDNQYIVRKGTLCRWINRYIVKQSRQHMQYMQSTSEFVASFLLIYSSVVQNNQKSKCKYWGTHLSVCSFAHTAHLFTCSALLTSLRSLVCFLAPSLTPKLVGK